MTLTVEQKEYFWQNGYLPYHRILSDEDLDVVRRRSEDIISGKVKHVPPRYIQFEAQFPRWPARRCRTARRGAQDDPTLLLR